MVVRKQVEISSIVSSQGDIQMTMEYFDSLQSTLVFLILTSSPVSCEFFPMTATKSGDYDNAPNAEQVVDGNPDTCTTAAESNADHRTASVFGWIQVDMGNPFSVISITLTAGEAPYFQNFVVLVSPSNSTDVQPSMTCATFNNRSSIAKGAQITLTCSPYPVVGRYITIKRQGELNSRQDAISLCEVVITRNPTAGYIYLYNLQTKQIGAFYGWNSSLAVDLDPQTCAQPIAPEGARGWWSIDLLNNYTITTITVYNSNTGSTQYLSQFEVKVGPAADENTQTLCYNFTDSVPAGGNATFDCAPLSIGRFLNVTRWGSDNTKALYLCEIYIKGQLFDGTIPPVLTSTVVTSTTSASTKSTTTSTSSAYSLSPSSSLLSPSLSLSSSSSNSSPPFLPSAASYSSTSIRNSYTSNASVDDSSGSNNTKIIIICVVVIIGGSLLLGSLGVAAFLLLRKRRIRRDSEGKPEKSIYDSIKLRPAPKTKPELHQSITADCLVSYVACNTTKNDGLKKEFQKLQKGDHAKVLVGQRPENISRNRFKYALPYDHTIVSLAVEEFDEPEANYINANHITSYNIAGRGYIATQDPMSETVNDFWRMVWQQDVDLIVMTTGSSEEGKKKSEKYWPTNLNMKKTFGKIFVQVTREETYAYHVYREMTVQDQRKATESSRTVRQMHFMEWGDRELKPEDILPLLCFRKKVRSLQISSSGPVVVHCSDGAGKTGTYIALDILLEQLKTEGAISFFKCVESLRNQRMNMVQTLNQYAFLHEVVAYEQQTIGDTAIPCATFEPKFSDLCQNTPHTSKLEQQFAVLKKLNEVVKVRKSAGGQPDNSHKNRDIITYNDERRHINGNQKENSYMKAVYVDGYRKKDAFVLTPLLPKDTVHDFCRLCWNYQLKTIVLLSNKDDSLEFWPEEGKSQTHGSFTVRASSAKEEFPSFTRREFSLANNSQTSTRLLLLQQYQIKGWPEDAIVPSNCRPMLDLMLALLDNSSPEDTVVIQCTDGSTRSGLLATAMYMVDMMKEEQSVDVFLACQFIALKMPQTISSLEQYSFLHKLALAYIDHIQTTSAYTTLIVARDPSASTNGAYSNDPTSLYTALIVAKETPALENDAYSNIPFRENSINEYEN